MPIQIDDHHWEKRVDSHSKNITTAFETIRFYQEMHDSAVITLKNITGQLLETKEAAGLMTNKEYADRYADLTRIIGTLNGTIKSHSDTLEKFRNNLDEYLGRKLEAQYWIDNPPKKPQE